MREAQSHHCACLCIGPWCYQCADLDFLLSMRPEFCGAEHLRPFECWVFRNSGETSELANKLYKDTERMPSGCQKDATGYQNGTNISHNEPRAPQKNPPRKSMDASVAITLFLFSKMIGQRIFWEPFGVQRCSNIDAKIDAERVAKMMPKGYSTI